MWDFGKAPLEGSWRGAPEGWVWGVQQTRVFAGESGGKGGEGGW